MKTKWKITLCLAFLLFIGFAAVYAYLLSYDFNRLKPDVITAVKQATGRDLTIQGDIKVAIGLVPSLLIERVALQNAGWGSRSRMAQIKRFELQLALLPLMTGTLEVRKASLFNADLFLEVNTQGHLNLPAFGAASPAPAPQNDERGRFLPRIALKNLRIVDSRFAFKGRLAKKPLQLHIRQLRLKSSRPGGAGTLSLTAAYNKKPLTAKGSVGSLNQLLDPEKPWPLELAVASVGSKVELAGTVRDVFKAEGLDLTVTFNSRNLSRTLDVAGLAVPFRKDVRIAGRLSGSLSKGIKLSRMQVKSGHRRVQGFVLAKLRGGKPYFNVTLQSQRLDLRPEPEPKAPAIKSPAVKPARKIFSTRPFPRGILRKVDADIGIRIRQCLLPKTALQNLRLNLRLKNGRLSLRPFTAVVGGGKFNARASLVEIRRKLVLNASLDVADLNAARMLRQLDITEALEGEFDINAAFAGRGASLSEIMAGANGHVWVTMGPGHLYNRLLAAGGGDLRAGLFDLLTPGDQAAELTKINCFAARFDITDGIAATRVFVLDTTALRAIGKGAVNLKTEKLDIALDPIPKKGVGTEGVGKIHLSLGNLAKPFKLGGTLANPSLAIDAGRAALTLGKAVGGFALFGPFGLAALLIDGDASEKDLCKTATALARRKQSPAKQSRPDTGKSPQKNDDPPDTFLNGLKKLFK